MNFEFMKNLDGLNKAFESCSNAEDLALSKPDLSMVASRKSAEVLAKFVYLVSHAEETEDLSFMDILSDPTVKAYLNNTSVLNAFHYIRKQGNLAVHTLRTESSNTAVLVLKNLHYAVGEVALRMGLIDSYPSFDENIESNSNALQVDIPDVNQLALKMFLAYKEAEDVEKYVEPSLDLLYQTSLEGNIEMHEYLKFSSKPMQSGVIPYLQRYFCNLLQLSLERSVESNPDLYSPVELDVLLTLNGGESYHSSAPENFKKALFELLPEADGFTIDCKCTGIVREYFIGTDVDENETYNMVEKDPWWTGAGMFDKLESFKRLDRFEYKLSMFYPDKGSFRYEKILNGKSIDPMDHLSRDIVSQRFDGGWWGYNLDLCAEFDFEKHRDILYQLQDVVRNNLPEEEVPYCEGAWEDGDLHILCCSVGWSPECLEEVQVFLDKINEILLPIKDEISAAGEGTWTNSDAFAVATWTWTEDGFRVMGTLY